MHTSIKCAASFHGDAYEILKKGYGISPNFEIVLYNKKGRQNTTAPEMSIFI